MPPNTRSKTDPHQIGQPSRAVRRRGGDDEHLRWTAVLRPLGWGGVGGSPPLRGRGGARGDAMPRPESPGAGGPPLRALRLLPPAAPQRSPGAPRLPLPPNPPPKAGKTRNLGSGAEATEQVTARVGGSGRNSVRRPGGKREPPGRPGVRARDPTRCGRPGPEPSAPAPPGNSGSRALARASAVTPPPSGLAGLPGPRCSPAPLGHRLLSRTLAADAPADPRAAPPSW